MVSLAQHNHTSLLHLKRVSCQSVSSMTLKGRLLSHTLDVKTGLVMDQHFFSKVKLNFFISSKNHEKRYKSKRFIKFRMKNQ